MCAKKYKVIYADPPWTYRDKRDKHPRLCGGALKHYPTMDVGDIKTLDINSIADTNCILFMWATFPCLQEGLDTIAAWGFKYKTVAFSWVKLNKRNGKPFFGIGYYTKSNVEVCLLGVKGKPFKVSDSVSSVIMSPIAEHSVKPEEARVRIVQLCGDVPRVELFARRPTDGWDVYGNEVPDSIRLGAQENMEPGVTSCNTGSMPALQESFEDRRINRLRGRWTAIPACHVSHPCEKCGQQWFDIISKASTLAGNAGRNRRLTASYDKSVHLTSEAL